MCIQCFFILVFLVVLGCCSMIVCCKIVERLADYLLYRHLMAIRARNDNVNNNNNNLHVKIQPKQHVIFINPDNRTMMVSI